MSLAARKLEGAGFTSTQAEAIEAAVDVSRHDNLATKTDLANLRADFYRALGLQAAGIIAILGALKLL